MNILEQCNRMIENQKIICVAYQWKSIGKILGNMHLQNT